MPELTIAMNSAEFTDLIYKFLITKFQSNHTNINLAVKQKHKIYYISATKANLFKMNKNHNQKHKNGLILSVNL